MDGQRGGRAYLRARSYRLAAPGPAGRGRRRRICRGSGRKGRKHPLAHRLQRRNLVRTGAGGGFPRRHRSRTNRPPDAVERQRGGVRLQRAVGKRRREHHHHDCRHHAQGRHDLCAGGVGVPPRSDCRLHRHCRTRCRARQGVRAEGPRPSRRGASQPCAAGRTRRRGGGGAAFRRGRGL